MRTFDLTPLYRSAIGFDRLANMLEQRAESAAELPAVQRRAGRRRQIPHRDGPRRLQPREDRDRRRARHPARDRPQAEGRHQRTYLHRGIAARDFEQRFQLANHVKVTSASFDNGMLTIELVREVPEASSRARSRSRDANGTDNVQVLEQPGSIRAM
jgi:molecular chaperone IbpA